MQPTPTRNTDRHATTHDRHGRRHPETIESVGPTVDELAEAIEAIQNTDVPGTPPVSAVETVQEATDLPLSVGVHTIKSVGITQGRPGHGEMRSDTHVSSYEVELPIREIERETVEGNECPTCGEQRAVYSYAVHHNIAGGQSISCSFCGEDLHSQEWG